MGRWFLFVMCDVRCVVSFVERSYKHPYIQKQLRPSWFSCGHLLGGPMYQNYNYYMHLGCQKVTPFPHLVRHWWSEEVWSLWRALRQRGHSLLLCSKLYSKDIFQSVEYECTNVNTGLKKPSLATLDSWWTVVPSRAKWPTYPLFEGGALARLPDAVMLSTCYHWVLADDFKTSPHLYTCVLDIPSMLPPKKLVREFIVSLAHRWLIFQSQVPPGKRESRCPERVRIRQLGEFLPKWGWISWSEKSWALHRS